MGHSLLPAEITTTPQADSKRGQPPTTKALRGSQLAAVSKKSQLMINKEKKSKKQQVSQQQQQ